MNCIWILSRPKGSKGLPRPYNAASSKSELVEMVGRKPGDCIDLQRINTDKPIFVADGTEFFAFSAPF